MNVWKTHCSMKDMWNNRQSLFFRQLAKLWTHFTRSVRVNLRDNCSKLWLYRPIRHFRTWPRKIVYMLSLPIQSNLVIDAFENKMMMSRGKPLTLYENLQIEKATVSPKLANRSSHALTKRSFHFPTHVINPMRNRRFRISRLELL